MLLALATFCALQARAYEKLARAARSKYWPQAEAYGCESSCCHVSTAFIGALYSRLNCFPGLKVCWPFLLVLAPPGTIPAKCGYQTTILGSLQS